MSDTEGDIRVGWIVTPKDGMVHLDIARHAEMTMTAEQAELMGRHLIGAALHVHREEGPCPDSGE